MKFLNRKNSDSSDGHSLEVTPVTPVASLANVEALSDQLITAAGNNDVAEIKRLRVLGADINYAANVTFGAGALIISADGFSQPVGGATPLMVALHNGAFEAALYLAHEGADGTYERTENIGRVKTKALDFLLSDHAREQAKETSDFVRSFSIRDKQAEARAQQNYQTDLFTPEQRIQIFDALVANAKDPLSLASEQTADNAIKWGRSEIIPKLKGIGVEITNQHFVDAAHPTHRPHLAIPMMAALLPYVRDVNVVGGGNENAGHQAAAHADLGAFKWLEERELDRLAVADFNVPTYAHLVARPRIGDDDIEKRVAFAQYLVDQGYPLNIRSARYGTGAPADVAFSEGNIPVGLVYLNAPGAEANSKYLVAAINSRHYNSVTTPELLDLVDTFRERNWLDQRALRAAFDEIIQLVRLNEKNVSALGPVVKALVGEGLQLEQHEKPLAEAVIKGDAKVHQAAQLGS
jgi:hypothetical protein